MPIAGAFTAGLGIGGYYAGKAFDEEKSSYKLLEGNP